MKLIESEQEAQKVKQILEEQMEFCDEEETRQYSSLEINWDDECKTWEQIKEKNINLMQKPENSKLFFISHDKDIIKGKPQLIESTKRKIVLLRKVEKIIRKKDREDLLIQYKFLGDLFDKRYDGREIDLLAFDFWLYRVISEGKEYYLLSNEILPNETCEFSGMSIELDDFAEFSRSMKIKTLSNVFIMKSFNPSVKLISKEELINLTKENNITEQDWFNFLGYHPLGNINRFPKDVELLRSAFILSGKNQGYPLHLGIMGVAGTKKTMGHLDCIGYKFSEEPNICEGANSRIKGLSPSFKEKPADIGFLARCERIGLIDEVGKMVEFESTKSHNPINNVLGELNFLLEHKKRSVSSGNANECQVQANAKFIFVTNPVSNRETIHKHTNIIDKTTMSRILWWVQDKDEVEFVMSPEAISPNTYTSIYNRNNINKDKKSGAFSGNLVRVIGESIIEQDRPYFLTLFDSCYSFMCEIDDLEVQKIISTTLNIAREPMKSSVWKPRAQHHVKLVIDGLVKHRCLFKDYDPSFTPKQEDYDLTEAILVRMVQTWETNFEPEYWKEMIK